MDQLTDSTDVSPCGGPVQPVNASSAGVLARIRGEDSGDDESAATGAEGDSISLLRDAGDVFIEEPGVGERGREGVRHGTEQSYVPCEVHRVVVAIVQFHHHGHLSNNCRGKGREGYTGTT